MVMRKVVKIGHKIIEAFYAIEVIKMKIRSLVYNFLGFKIDFNKNLTKKNFLKYLIKDCKKNRYTVYLLQLRHRICLSGLLF
jgi:hypothetical protein